MCFQGGVVGPSGTPDDWSVTAKQMLIGFARQIQLPNRWVIIESFYSLRLFLGATTLWGTNILVCHCVPLHMPVTLGYMPHKLSCTDISFRYYIGHACSQIPLSGMSFCHLSAIFHLSYEKCTKILSSDHCPWIPNLWLSWYFFSWRGPTFTFCHLYFHCSMNDMPDFFTKSQTCSILV